MQRVLNRQEILNQSIQSTIIHNKLHTTKYIFNYKCIYLQYTLQFSIRSKCHNTIEYYN